MSSQRDIGFRGGIQFGQTTYDALTKDTDALVKNIASELSQDSDILNAGISWSESFSEKEACGLGIYPDFGAWRLGEKLFASGDAKKQNATGNAHERVYKPMRYLFLNNPDARFIVLASGKGVNVKGTMRKDLSAVLQSYGKPADAFNICHPDGVSCFISERGFNKKQLYTILKTFVLGTTGEKYEIVAKSKHPELTLESFMVASD